MALKTGTSRIHQLLSDERIRSFEVEGERFYRAVELVAVLTESEDARAEWDEIKQAESSLRSRCVQADVEGEAADFLGMTGVMRLILAVDSPKAARLQNWLADVGARHVAEEADPELAIQRMRQSYAAEGRTRRWIDQRLRSISARQEIVSEWYKRDVKTSEQFRLLTNKLMEAVFGMDVASLREFKGYARDLRDHLSALELSLLSLAETSAAMLHRQRGSIGMEQLLHDVEEAGRIISETQRQILLAAGKGQRELAA